MFVAHFIKTVSLVSNHMLGSKEKMLLSILPQTSLTKYKSLF